MAVATAIVEIDDLVDWERRVLPIPAGAHTISWRYEKDGNGTEGEDAAWLDEVQVIDGRDPEGDGLPTIVEACLGLDWKKPSFDQFQLPVEVEGRLSWQIVKGTDLEGISPIIEISYDLANWSKHITKATWHCVDKMAKISDFLFRFSG